MAKTYIDKYRPLDQTVHRWSSPAGTAIGLWLVFAVLALLYAQDLHRMVALDDRVRAREVWLPLSEANLTVAEALGLDGLGPAVSRLSAWFDRSPVLFVPQLAGAAPDPAAEPPTPADTPTVGTTPGPPPAAPEATAWKADNGLPTPHSVLLIGASSMQYYLGADLERRLEQVAELTVHRLGKLSTGLTRPDVFDWPAKLAELQAAHRPDLVIAQFGGNDCQPIVGAKRNFDFGTPGWDEEYSSRVRAFVAGMRAGGATAVMLGMPIVRSPRFASRLEHLNLLLERETLAAGGLFLPTWDLTTDERGRYLKSVTHAGDTGLMRLSDGVHFARLGSRYVADRLLARLERQLNLTPRDPAQAVARRFDIDSALRATRASFLAYVPQGTGGPWPLLLLLHGAGGSWTDWSEHAHAVLQRLAGELGLVIVTPDGAPEGWYLDSPLVPANQIESYLLSELLPELERRLPLDGQRAIAGLSMGGHGALTLALRHPETFATASSMSGVVDLTAAAARKRKTLVALLGSLAKNREVWEAHSALHLVRAQPERARALAPLFTVGRRDRWLKANRALDAALTGLGLPHTYRESDGGHTWDTWTAELEAHLRFAAARLGRLPAPAPEADHQSDPPPNEDSKPKPQPESTPIQNNP